MSIGSNKLAIDNPFKIPSDEKIFHIRNVERHSMLSRHTSRLKSSKTEVLSFTARLREIVGNQKVLKISDLLKVEMEAINRAYKRPTQENTVDYVAKRKDMFYAKMTLNTKRGEIRKLEEKAQLKEDALKQAGKMVEEDGIRFEVFLNGTNRKAGKAIKRAEEETRRRQEKSNEIKRLTQNTETLVTDLTKLRDKLEDCLRYKSFLDMLTPTEWFEQHQQRHQEKVDKIKQDNFRAKHKEWDRLRRKLTEDHRKDAEIKRELKNKEKNKKSHALLVEEEDEEEEEIKLVIPPAPRLEDEIVDIPIEDVPMYFTEPQQLMDIFSALEEQILFLIQNSQETERTLEELKHEYSVTRSSMDGKVASLQSEIDVLAVELTVQENSLEVLLRNKRVASAGFPEISSSEMESGMRTTALSDHAHSEKERMLKILHSKVRKVYDLCGFDANSKSSTLYMLSQLESKLEMLLQDTEEIPDEFMLRAEKEKEKKRRELKRAQQQEKQEKQQEERNRRAIERSMQAPKKRNGPPVMYRSRLINKELKKTMDYDVIASNSTNDEVKYFS